MEMVKTYPKLSPFQQVLLRGLHEGVLMEGDIERIKSEGAKLTLTTADRFFRASAREESYRYAVRLIETLLSFYLTTHSGDAVQELKQGSLAKIVRECVMELRKLDQLPISSLLPRMKADVDLVDWLVKKAEKLRLTTKDILADLEGEITRRKQMDEAITLAEFFIQRVGGKLHHFDDEAGEAICNAQFMAIIYGLAIGPHMTLAILKKLAKRKRPSLEDVESKLRAHVTAIPMELQAIYGRMVNDFLAYQGVIAFFGQKASISVFFGPYGSMYFAEKGAEAFADD